MAITDWPVDERPRGKLLQRGALTLSDAELLAIFLRTGIRGKTAADLAHQIAHLGYRATTLYRCRPGPSNVHRPYDPAPRREATRIGNIIIGIMRERRFTN